MPHALTKFLPPGYRLAYITGLHHGLQSYMYMCMHMHMSHMLRRLRL